ncbi:hypothetical protein COV93_05395 [Candidatus Woesearchaeota archaeon CG11_big_fil_rev_8_21_14_0_20_43_8]|nr:MAG: hypothetical protein COV93_05395 [Candidatus Woesearchaeota archaeon CG11_big_fil_rev_8_21_14_0_20_43_8]PIO05203.1 MAG: hypothetical protein COT47_05820 [Candidatus Woesearchaeota archaeon CG08_land_8_20_14_0_20_43_7]
MHGMHQGNGKEIIRYESVSKNFGKRIILDNVSFSIKQGEIFGIVGMSGSGKTTLLNLLIGFIEPEMGDIKFLSDLSSNIDSDGVYLSTMQYKKEVKNMFGFAAQTPSFYERLTCEENLDYFGCMHDIKRGVRKTNTKILLQLMGLHDSAKKLGCELSGGMQKRLDIACTLVNDPKVLILDEPTSNLDPILRKQMWELIRKINAGGTTIIMASHFIDEIESLCDRVIIVHNGKITDLGSPSELRTLHPETEDILLQSSPGDHQKIIKRLKDVKSSISRISKVGNKLCITTTKSEAVLHKILHALEASGEILLELEINKSSITDIFEKIIKEKDLNKGVRR